MSNPILSFQANPCPPAIAGITYRSLAGFIGGGTYSDMLAWINANDMSGVPWNTGLNTAWNTAGATTPDSTTAIGPQGVSQNDANASNGGVGTFVQRVQYWLPYDMSFLIASLGTTSGCTQDVDFPFYTAILAGCTYTSTYTLLSGCTCWDSSGLSPVIIDLPVPTIGVPGYGNEYPTAMYFATVVAGAAQVGTFNFTADNLADFVTALWGNTIVPGGGGESWGSNGGGGLYPICYGPDWNVDQTCTAPSGGEDDDPL